MVSALFFYVNKDYRLKSDRIFYIVLIEKYPQESLSGKISANKTLNERK